MAEESGNQRNSMTRLLLILAGPAAACMVWFLLPSDLSAPARSVAAMGVLMAVWWMTEALPIEATGLVPLVALPLSGAMKLDQAAAPYADRVIFLFLGGMLLGAAMENWNLHRRFALWVISIVGTKPSRLIAAFLFATAALSMFISNAAATVMMLPIGISVIKWVRGAVTPEMPGGEACLKHLGPAVVLAIALREHRRSWVDHRHSTYRAVCGVHGQDGETHQLRRVAGGGAAHAGGGAPAHLVHLNQGRDAHTDEGLAGRA